MDSGKLKKYAELLVRSGGNVQKGQLVVISCNVDNAFFGRMVAEAAYDAGASDVRVDWVDDVLGRMNYLRAASETFDAFPQWRVDKAKEQDDRGAVYLHIISSDPDNLKGVDPDRIRRFSTVSNTALRPHSENRMKGDIRWSLVAVPSPAWAKKVFPDLTEADAIEKLWEYLLKGARADGDNPIEDWKKHKETFAKRVNYLNDMQFTALRFKNSLGTDFTVGLAKNHAWVGGGGVANDGVATFPNIPTEEIFTMPDRNICDGRVVASMPLSYMGSLIENFELTFKDGKVVDYKAEKGLDTLKTIIEMDEGSARLGEVALVANSSPIGQMGTLFYNTLFDENASSHLALGRAYPKNLVGGTKMSKAELEAAGANDSLLHVDFMFGTADMQVVGITEHDCCEVLFFDNGEFVN